MTNLELYKSDFYRLPREYESTSFQEYVQNTLQEYLDRLKEFNGELGQTIEVNLPKIEALCNSIIDSLDYALQGLLAKSYLSFKEGVDGVKEYLLYPKPEGERIFLASGNIVNYFRIREHFNRLSKEEIFHIPFQQRHLTKSNRFSVSGLPCLYLSNTLYLCWEELGKPTNKKLQASKFVYDRNKLKLIDLTYIPQKIVFLNQPNKACGSTKPMSLFFRESLITWPLSFASLIHTRYRKSVFKIEYTIPQHLIQWCRDSEDLDGVKYFSTRTSFVNAMGIPFNQENIAFPVKSSGGEGHCEKLKQIFKLTEPIKIADFKHMRGKQLSEDDKLLWIERNADGYMNFFLRTTASNEKYPTIFDRAEIELLKKEVSSL